MLSDRWKVNAAIALSLVAVGSGVAIGEVNDNAISRGDRNTCAIKQAVTKIADRVDQKAITPEDKHAVKFYRDLSDSLNPVRSHCKAPK